jgi:hypothetical protein
MLGRPRCGGNLEASFWTNALNMQRSATWNFDTESTYALTSRKTMENFNRVTSFERKSCVQVIFCQILPDTQSVAFSLNVFRDCPLVLLISLKKKIKMNKQWNDTDREKNLSSRRKKCINHKRDFEVSKFLVPEGLANSHEQTSVWFPPSIGRS